MIRERTDYGPWGSVEHREVYDAGGTLIADGPAMHPFGFAGGMRDVHHPWVRFGARDYDPIAGRWLSRDPLLFAGGDTNLFRYVNNDPVNTTDPQGLFTWKDGREYKGSFKDDKKNGYGVLTHPVKQNEKNSSGKNDEMHATYDRYVKSMNVMEEAKQKADQLRDLNNMHHIFIGEVGKWLPWDPEADKVQNEEYLAKRRARRIREQAMKKRQKAIQNNKRAPPGPPPPAPRGSAR